jgi:hypothetical protein
LNSVTQRTKRIKKTLKDQVAKQHLIHYLLGGLKMEERRQIEERYFDDEAFFQEMLIIEEELIDSYVYRDLSDEEVEQFEKYYLTTPERRVQVEFATALAASLPKVIKLREFEEVPAQPPPVRLGLLAVWRERLRPVSWTLIISVAATVVLLLGIAGLWLRGQARRFEQESAALSQQRKETSQLNEKLERKLDHLEQLKKRFESLTAASTGDTNIAIGTLFPMLTRSGEAGQFLRISSQTSLLLLQAPAESVAGKTYQATLARDGIEILQLYHLSSQITPNGMVIEIPLTGAMLNGHSYYLTVKSEDEAEDLDIYSFEIQKP